MLLRAPALQTYILKIREMWTKNNFFKLAIRN